MASAPIQTRSERLRSVDPKDFSAPTGREVDWKYTPVDQLDDFFSDTSGTVATVTSAASVPVAVLSRGSAPWGEFFVPENIVSAAVFAHVDGAAHLVIPAQAEYDEAVTLNVATAGGFERTHIVIEAQSQSKATVVLRHHGAGRLAENVEIIVRDAASLTVIALYDGDQGSVCLSDHQAQVGRDGYLRHIVLSLGGDLTRVNPSIELTGNGSEAEVYGLAFADDGQHKESQVYLFHKGADTKGDVLYKSALQGARARAVWVGDVLIGPDARGTDSYEANRNLVLTPGARADSVPNLEIQTGDINGAGHASATGRFDEEQLFYLQSRGISETEARRLVVLGFLTEIAQKIGVAELEQQVITAVTQRLEGGVL